VVTDVGCTAATLPPIATALLDGMRADGWSVAVHNDYTLGGDAYTFWLLTHPNGRYVKGESITDAEALAACRRQIDRYSITGPAEPYAVTFSENSDKSGWLSLGFNTYADAVNFWRWAGRMMEDAKRR
jgi:hypothetical protein